MLLLIAEEAYAKAWLAADVPFVFDKQWLGGTWTTGVNWSEIEVISTVGINEEIIRDYIEKQGKEDSGQAKLELD